MIEEVIIGNEVAFDIVEFSYDPNSIPPNINNHYDNQLFLEMRSNSWASIFDKLFPNVKNGINNSKVNILNKFPSGIFNDGYDKDKCKRLGFRINDSDNPIDNPAVINTINLLDGIGTSQYEPNESEYDLMHSKFDDKPIYFLEMGINLKDLKLEWELVKMI